MLYKIKSSMRTNKIFLELPVSDNPNRSFSVQLKSLEPTKSEYPATDRILVVSNLRGNFRNFIKLLVRHKVLDKHFKWTFGVGHLVMLGNYFQSPAQTQELWLLYALEEKARRQGGYVHYILGTDELTHLNGEWWQTHPRYANGQIPGIALFEGNRQLLQWLESKNIIEKIGGLLFVQAGIFPERSTFSLAEINSFKPFHQRTAAAMETMADGSLTNDPVALWYQEHFKIPADELGLMQFLEHFQAKTVITASLCARSVDIHFNGQWLSLDSTTNGKMFDGLLLDQNSWYRIGLHQENSKEKLL
jgi:hypothetical protein